MTAFTHRRSMTCECPKYPTANSTSHDQHPEQALCDRSVASRQHNQSAQLRPATAATS